MPVLEGSVSWYWHLWPALATIILWWGATGVIAWLVGRPASSYRSTLLGASLLAIISLAAIAALAHDTTGGHAWLSFLAALGLWSWLEVTFLTGTITGPHRPRSQPRHGIAHAWDAIRAILWHELAIIAVVSICAIVTWSAENRIGLYTLLLLWVMRSSAKLNLFLGVRNLGEVFLPKHLQHLIGFFRQRQMNLLFPFSILLGSALTWQLASFAITANDVFTATAFSMLATLSALAVLEHWLMVLPIPAEALWRWSLHHRQP
jgi:putative photosynthetic complex assembly protein 2